MSYRKFVLVTSVIGLGLTGAVAYLYYDRANVANQSWSAAIQNEDEALRRIIALESLLARGQLNEVRTELKRHRQRSLTSLLVMINYQFRSGSPNMAYALRKFCAEVPVDLPEPKYPSDKIFINAIKGTEPLCEPAMGNPL